MADEDDDTDAVNIPDILAFEPVERSHRGGRRGTVAALVLIPVFLGAAGWAAWHYLGDLLVVEDAYDIPLIRANPGPVKVRPENPGGMQVPDQDKLVYGRMRGDNPPEVERLLARPEPLLLPPTATPPAPAEKKAATAPLSLTPPTPTTRTSSLIPTGPPKAASAVSSTEEALAAKPVPPPPPPKAAAPPAAGGDLQVQLAAIRSPEQARGEWERLRRKNGDLLGKLRLFITKADLGPGKGVYFRLRAGPLASEAQAKALCASLAGRKIGCLVVRPEG
jgi:cell division septation protein DedD